MSERNYRYKSEYKEHNYTFWGILILVCLIIAFVIFFRYQMTKNNSSENVSQTTVNNDVKNEISEQEPVVYTAEEIINKLKEKGFNIGRVVVYNEETDLNELLGRPNQYITKINFEDTRIEDNVYLDEDTMLGGTIETFNNNTDMKNRQQYCEAISSRFSISNQYICGNDYALLRIDNELTPSQAKEYEEAFNKIIDGN